MIDPDGDIKVPEVMGYAPMRNDSDIWAMDVGAIGEREQYGTCIVQVSGDISTVEEYCEWYCDIISKFRVSGKVFGVIAIVKRHAFFVTG